MARTLDGQRVVVVGASAGIGRELALRAVRGGAKVMLAARGVERLEELAAGGLPVALDIRDPESCAATAERVRWEFGTVDLVVCSAGYSRLRSFDEVSPTIGAAFWIST